MPRDDWVKAYKTAKATAAVECAENRRLVLARPHLAKRLTMPPMRYSEPAQWNGWIPPYMVPHGAGHCRNDSPQRIRLVAIVRAAMAEAYSEQIAAEWLNEINTDRWSGPWSPHAAIERN